MGRFIVTYDLIGTSESSDDYRRLISAIKRYPWAKLQYSTWIVVSTKSPKAIWTDLWAHMDPDDRLFVAELTGAAAWQNPICSTEWLQNNL